MIYQLMRRNLRIYFRDRASVFFSLLGVFIMIGLYALFLGNMWVDGYGQALEGMGLGESADGVRFLIDSWIIAGVVAAASITTTMGAYGIMVDDNAKKIVKDFRVSPIPRWKLVMGYVLSSIVIGWIMSVFTLLLGEFYIIAYGGKFLDVMSLLETLGLITLSVSASSALVFFLISFIKSQNAFGTASTLLGTLIGFFMGVYVAIGNLPTQVQWAVKCFPIAHAGSLLRQVMVGYAQEEVFGSLNEIETAFLNGYEDLEGVYHSGFHDNMGVYFRFGDYLVPSWLSILILLATVLVFFGLTTWVVSRRKAKE